MAFNLSVRLDDKDLKRLSALEGRAKFAGAKALTLTAKDAQAGLQAEAGAIFNLRNSWVVKGIRIRAATPATMTATVGSIDKYMSRHVFGDDKPPARSLSIRNSRDSRGRVASGGLLIPSYSSISQVGKHQATRGKLRRIDGQKRKTFQILGKGGGVVLIVRRTSKKRKPLEVLSILHGQAVDMHPTFKMYERTQAVVRARFALHFERAVASL